MYEWVGAGGCGALVQIDSHLHLQCLYTNSSTVSLIYICHQSRCIFEAFCIFVKNVYITDLITGISIPIPPHISFRATGTGCYCKYSVCACIKGHGLGPDSQRFSKMFPKI